MLHKTTRVKVRVLFDTRNTINVEVISTSLGILYRDMKMGKFLASGVAIGIELF